MFAVIVLLGIIAIIIRGFAMVDLWEWFIMPLSTTLPELGFWHALGVTLFLNYATFSLPSKISEERDVEEEALRAVALILMPLLVWGVGAIYHSFMV